MSSSAERARKYRAKLRSNPEKWATYNEKLNRLRRDQRSLGLYRETNRRWRAENPRKVFDNDLRSRYGVGVEWLDEKLIEQSGRCEICSKPLWAFHIDHNHQTHIVRNLLCPRCNNGLGFIEDQEFLSNAIQYLKKWSK